MDDYTERLERLMQEAEEMYRTDELSDLLCWYKDNGTGDFMKVIAHALKRRDYQRAGRFLGALVDTYAPELAKDYAKRRVE